MAVNNGPPRPFETSLRSAPEKGSGILGTVTSVESEGTEKPAPPLPLAIAVSVRSRRERAGLSQSELASLAGLSSGTLSALEAGSGNPTITTLARVGDVLGCSIAELVETAADTMSVSVPSGSRTQERGSALRVGLLHRFAPNGPVEIYDMRIASDEQRLSEPHPEGVYEHVYLTSGALTTGPEGSPASLRPGDYVCFPGWTPHLYHAGPDGADAVLILSYTRSLLATRELLGHGVLPSPQTQGDSLPPV